MKIIKQDGNVRLVRTIGNYMEYRYEIQEKYSYWEHDDDESPTISWAMRCYSHDLKQAYEMYEKIQNNASMDELVYNRYKRFI